MKLKRRIISSKLSTAVDASEQIEDGRQLSSNRQLIPQPCEQCEVLAYLENVALRGAKHRSVGKGLTSTRGSTMRAQPVGAGRDESSPTQDKRDHKEGDSDSAGGHAERITSGGILRPAAINEGYGRFIANDHNPDSRLQRRSLEPMPYSE
jgi:hypothetical protein